MSSHKWVGDKCETCNVTQQEVGSYLRSAYCYKTPEAIATLERQEYDHLKKARDCGRIEGQRYFKSRQNDWNYLDAKYGKTNG